MKKNLNLWPLGIFGAFALFFIGMASVVIIASTHREHLVNDNYYEQELKFQDQIDAATRAKKSGATAVYDIAGRQIVVTVPVTQLAAGISGTIEFYRPSAPELDKKITLQPGPDGTQVLNVTELAPGPWSVRVQWNARGENYFIENKMTVAAK